MKHWIVFDATFLCHRAFHAMGDLSHEGVATAVPFGFFQDVINVQERFDPHGFVFCFDRGTPKRKESYPQYKEKREKRTEEEQEARRSLQEQIKRLARELLPSVGFANVFSAKGFEADDLIASVVCDLGEDERATIVSADQDLWQLIGSQVRCYNPNKGGSLLTVKKFREQWGIEPIMWADVKAIAGCTSDNVEGVPGVGEKTAAKFLRGELKRTTKAHEKIVEANDVWQSNLELVLLPLPGTPRLQLSEDGVSSKRWREVMRSIGVESLRDMGEFARAG